MPKSALFFFTALEIDSLNLKKTKTIKPQRSTKVREAYFLKYAEAIKEVISKIEKDNFFASVASKILEVFAR